MPTDTPPITDEEVAQWELRCASHHNTFGAGHTVSGQPCWCSFLMRLLTERAAMAEHLAELEHKLDFTNRESTFNRLNEQRQEMISRALDAESKCAAMAERIVTLEKATRRCRTDHVTPCSWEQAWDREHREAESLRAQLAASERARERLKVAVIDMGCEWETPPDCKDRGIVNVDDWCTRCEALHRAAEDVAPVPPPSEER